MAARIFTSSDYDHDESLRNLLVGKSRNDEAVAVVKGVNP